MILLEEATFDQIFKELTVRFPEGVVLAHVKPGETDDYEDSIRLAFHRILPSIGLVRTAIKIMEKCVLEDVTNRELDDEDEEEEIEE